MKLSAKDLLEFQIVDEIIQEPPGGAHRDKDLILENVRNSISKNLENFKSMTKDEIFLERKNKFLKIGRNKGYIYDTDSLSSLKLNQNNFSQIIKSKKTIISIIVLFLVLTISLTFFL